MDKNIEIVLDEFEHSIRESMQRVEKIKKYYEGFEFSKKKDDLKNFTWRKFEDCKPEGYRCCLVSWWDNQDESYVQPIMSYWCEDRERFLSLEFKTIIAVDVDIWCYCPELPEVKL